MFPLLSVDYTANNGMPDSIFISKLLLCYPTIGVAFSYLNYLMFLEFRVTGKFANLGSSMSNHILHILGMCTIKKIGTPIVRWISIIMPNLFPVWAWANKCQKNKTMDKCHFLDFPNAIHHLGQGYIQMSTLSRTMKNLRLHY